MPPLVSVVIETVTVREHGDDRPLAEKVRSALTAVSCQHYPPDRIETILVLDDGTRQDASEIERHFPWVRIVFASRSNYFAAKNAGAAAAHGDIVALLDADCTPAPEWLEALVSGFRPDVDVVAGRTRYTGHSLSARTFSVSDFGNVVETSAGRASGFNVNNVAFRRDLLLAHPLDARVRRNGGCYFLYHKLRALGATMLYEPGAVIEHGLDVGGLGFVRKHFERGFDGTNVYRIDERGVLNGTKVYRRFGLCGLVALSARRILLDWVRIVRDRRQLGISIVTVPYFAVVVLTIRLIELAGGLTAAVGPAPAPREQPSHT
jgi:glycosyltransferase involved in cell wall biosynthesis